MNNALAYIGGFIAVVLAALFAVPYFVDWNSYRGVFEEEATRVLGREVRVGGGVNLRLLPSPYVRFEKLRIADAGVEQGESIFRAESFTMWLSVPPLLRGVIEANKIELTRPVLQLKANAEGSGNWAQFTLNPGLMPFVPAEVALQSVTIIDGVLGFSGPARADLARIEAINGDLSAEALAGPYKFKGTANWRGSGREIRLATAAQDADGAVRFKMAVDAKDTANVYTLEGRALDLTGKPRLEGELKAKIKAQIAASPAAAADASPDASPIAPAPSGNGAVAPEFELTGKLKGDAGSFELTEISVVMDQGGPPQLITGEVKARWTERTSLDLAFASKWLDLDRLVAAGEAPVPLETVRGLFDRLVRGLPADADTNASLHLDQLTLGGEAIGNVRLDTGRVAGPLEIKELKADLPGGSRLDLSGVLTSGESEPGFDGQLSLRGQSLMRFLAWGFREKGIGEGRSDGPYSLEGRLALGEASIELTGASAEFAASPMTGELRLGLGKRPKLSMMVEGRRLDAGQVRPGIVSLGALRDLFAGGSGTANGAAAGSPRWLDPKNADLSLKIKTAELVDGRRSLKNVDAEMEIQEGRFSMPAIRFSTDEGLKAELEGHAALLDTAAKGEIRGLIAAPDAKAVAAFFELFDLPEAQRVDTGRLQQLAPLRLAGTVSIGERQAAAIDISLDGLVKGSRAVATARLDGALQEWRDALVDVTATFDSQDTGAIAAALLGRGGESANAIRSRMARKGRVVLKSVGIPSAGLLSLASLESDGLAISFNGRSALPAGAAPTHTGDLVVAARDTQAVFALAGLSTGAAVQAAPIEGTLSATAGEAGLTLATDGLSVGGSKVKGKMSLARIEGKPVALEADLETDSASFGALLAPFLDRAVLAEAAPAPVTAPGRKGEKASPVTMLPVWPEQAFDLSGLGGIEGNVKLSIGTLAIEPGLSVHNAQLTTALTRDRITVSSLQAEALGGTVSSSLTIEKAAAGVGMSGKLAIAIAGEPGPAAEGDGDATAFSVDFAGRALSPGALVSDLKGKGQLTLAGVALAGMSPSAVAEVATAAVQAAGPTQGEPLTEAVRAALKQGQLPLGNLVIPVEIGDGALKLGEVTIDQEDGRSTFKTVVDLLTMQIDSEWQIEPRITRTDVTPPERVMLPPVSVVYVGKLKDFAALEPVVATGALERELTVRKMEKDVTELEKLRKLDQTRARQEAERQKALEAERQKALEIERLKSLAVPDAGPEGEAQPGALPPGAAAPVPGDQSGTSGGTSVPDAASAIPGAEASAAGADRSTITDAAPVRRTKPAARPIQKRSQGGFNPFQINP